MADVGRPTVMTPELLNKLEEVFAIGGSDTEACFYANISPETMYKYGREHPEFMERKEALKEKPILKARQTIVKGLDDPDNAKWYLERKKKKEFAQRTELTGNEGEQIVGFNYILPKEIPNDPNNSSDNQTAPGLPDTTG